MEPLNWTHILIEAGFIVVPLLGAGIIGYLKLSWTNQQFPPHRHNEKLGTLYVDGVIYPREDSN